jgi:hypothetical protein
VHYAATSLEGAGSEVAVAGGDSAGQAAMSFRRQSTFVCWFAAKARRNNVRLSGEANRKSHRVSRPMCGSSDGSHRGQYLEAVRSCERRQGDRAQDPEHRLAQWLRRARCQRIHRDGAHPRGGRESRALLQASRASSRSATGGQTPWTGLLRASAKGRSSCMRSTPGLADFLSDFTLRDDPASSISRSPAETEPRGDLPTFTELNSWSAERTGSVLDHAPVDMWRPL